jgi:Glyoxalase-like domain
VGSLVRHITFDCAEPHTPYELAEFWSRVLGHPIDPEDELDDDEVGLDAPAGQPILLFVRVPEAKSQKSRLHLDLEPDWPRDEEVERLLALGASLVDDRRTANGRGWVVLVDPAGNEFCVEGSAAERSAAEEADRAAEE